MFKVTILGFKHAYASAITGAIDLFSLAGVTWQRMHGSQPIKQFNVELATVGGEAIQCINRIELSGQVDIAEVKHTDLLLVPTIGGPLDEVLAENQSLIEHISRLHNTGSDIASNCSGAFFLAEAGILDHRPATTHWGYAEIFKQRYPAVKLQAEQLITQSDNIYCAGGGMAWFDLALLLIERYCGHEVASQTAKSHVIDLARDQQVAYANVAAKRQHQDHEVREIQTWIDQNFCSRVTISELARRFNLSQRTMIRRFKAATGFSPLNYLQNTRLENAKKFLENESWPLQLIVSKVGYDDISSFSRLFQRRAGLTPIQYRKKFQRRRIS
ncbi:MAG: helix-turn-helix domain-containing protein [Kangiellaceae bacterium]|jgi:transcriptional regulator GlxA family with amidase domain|nr:helix-turn-helix domain-containing protein [Kangiellaceae bacterium]